MKLKELHKLIKEEIYNETQIKSIQKKINELWLLSQYVGRNEVGEIKDEIRELEIQIWELGGIPMGKQPHQNPLNKKIIYNK